MKVVSLKSPWKGHQPLYVFDFLISLLNILKDFKVLSRFMQNSTQSSCLLGLRFACAQAVIFFTKPYSIMRERQQLFFGLRFAGKRFHHSVTRTKIELHFGGFFHQMKVRQPIGRQHSMQTVNRTSRRIGFNSVWSGSGLWRFLKYSRAKIKN